MSDNITLPHPALTDALTRYAFLLDIDGTLADLMPTPEDVKINDTVFNFFSFLSQHRIPYALVSGRAVTDIDRLFSSRIVACAGVHGAEIRYANGKYERLTMRASEVACVWERLKLSCSHYPALRLENKGISFAIHFRDAPELAGEATWIATSLAELYPDTFSVQHGKCVCELRPVKANKGFAIARIMASSSFSGKTPVYIGDDITDEAAFKAVNEMAGYSIKVGNEETAARYALRDVENVHMWLRKLMTGACESAGR